MRRAVFQTRFTPLCLAALGLTACASGKLSPVSIATADTLAPFAKGQPACGLQGNSRRLIPGDRLSIRFLSTGVQQGSETERANDARMGTKQRDARAAPSSENGPARMPAAAALNSDGNTYPPQLREIDLPLRFVNTGTGRLHPDEQATLATFLQVNRTAPWIYGNPSDPGGSDLANRTILAADIQGKEAAVWNAFVQTLCLSSVDTLSGKVDLPAPQITDDQRLDPSRRVFVIEADMLALCRSVSQKLFFEQAFIKLPADDVACESEVQLWRSFSGLLPVEHRGWAAATLGVSPAYQGTPYYAQVYYLHSPLAQLGQVEFGSVQPFGRDPPDWSLAEWQDAGICKSEGGEALVIRSVTLKGGTYRYRIVDRDTETTHEVVVENGRRKLNRLQKYLLDWSLSAKALHLLRADDVDALEWAPVRASGPHGKTARGCARRRT